MEATISQDYYYHYRFETTPVSTGMIVKVFRTAKHSQTGIEYVGSYFVQSKRVPANHCVNHGMFHKWEMIRRRGEPAKF